jgi:hypothetical protein
VLLAKSCFSKDNIKTRNTLKLGTLFEYRKIESAQIVDNDEGKYIFNLKFDGVVDIERQWFNLIFQGIINLGGDEHPRILGGMSARIDTINMIGSDERTIKIRDSAATIQREALNCFIFCTSLVRKTRDAIGIFPDYDDCWYIGANKAHQLGVTLSSLLHKKILAARASGHHLVDGNVPLDDLRVYCRHELVAYLPRETHISDTSKFSTEDFMLKVRDMAFVKPPSFSHELEYRYSFTIVAGGNILLPLSDNVILAADQIADWAFCV